MPRLHAALAFPLLCALVASGQEKKKEPSPPVRFTFTKQAKRPSIRLGDYFRADFRLSFQTDWRGHEPPESSDNTLFDLRRSRVGVEGEFGRYFEYEFDYELGVTEFAWRDAYVNFRPVTWLQVRGGKFKIPFSLDQLQGPMRLDFVYRSRIGALLAPGRDVGGEIHGRLFKRALNYEVGVFRHDGEIPYINDNTEPTGGTTYAARVTGTPLRFVRAPKLMQPVTFGVDFTTSQVSEGMKGLRGRTLGRETFFPASGQRMFVNGQRRRLGADAMWVSGPVSLKAEILEAREERKGQSLRGTDLPDLISRGWYLSGTWLVTGQKHSQRDEMPLRGFGAVELATRYEQIRFGSAGTAGAPPARNTRAANIAAQSDRVWTWGVNWYTNRWIKTQANVIREKLEDVQRSPAPGKVRLWTWVVRVQYTL